MAAPGPGRQCATCWEGGSIAGSIFLLSQHHRPEQTLREEAHTPSPEGLEVRRDHFGCLICPEQPQRNEVTAVRF